MTYDVLQYIVCCNGHMVMTLKTKKLNDIHVDNYKIYIYIFLNGVMIEI